MATTEQAELSELHHTIGLLNAVAGQLKTTRHDVETALIRIEACENSIETIYAAAHKQINRIQEALNKTGNEEL